MATKTRVGRRQRKRERGQKRKGQTITARMTTRWQGMYARACVRVCVFRAHLCRERSCMIWLTEGLDLGRKSLSALQAWGKVVARRVWLVCLVAFWLIETCLLVLRVLAEKEIEMSCCVGSSFAPRDSSLLYLWVVCPFFFFFRHQNVSGGEVVIDLFGRQRTFWQQTHNYCSSHSQNCPAPPASRRQLLSQTNTGRLDAGYLSWFPFHCSVPWSYFLSVSSSIVIICSHLLCSPCICS